MYEELIEDAFIYAYPLFAIAQTRYHAVQNGDNPRRHAPNTVLHERQLSDPSSLWITAPNNDTLYSNVWLDLTHGPVQIRLGAMPPGRYWSLALMDAFGNHIAMLGQRLDGIGPVEVTLIGPGHSADGLAGRVITAPGNDVWLFGRFLVDGPADLPQAHAMQDALEVRPLFAADYAPHPVPGEVTDPENFLRVVNHALARNPPPLAEANLLRSWSEIGLQSGSWQSLNESVRQCWQAGIEGIYGRLRNSGAKGRRDVQGWITSGPEIGNYGSNYALRASVALGGLGALEPIEACYFVKFHDAEQQLLDGQRPYLMRIPASGIPTDSFWSFSMYAPTAEGKRFFVANPIQRYSIGNRTPGLVYNTDGSLDIALQTAPPSEPRRLANWLPTPQGVFQISLRTYLPQAALRQGLARMPTIERL